MKTTKQNGYTILVNDEGNPIYCVERTPVQTIIPDKLNQPLAIEIPTQSSTCGDHCPFFELTIPIGGKMIVQLNCRGGHPVGISGEFKPEDKKSNLKILQ